MRMPRVWVLRGQALAFVYTPDNPLRTHINCPIELTGRLRGPEHGKWVQSTKSDRKFFEDVPMGSGLPGAAARQWDGRMLWTRSIRGRCLET